jgi:hypothetical protein
VVINGGGSGNVRSRHFITLNLEFFVQLIVLLGELVHLSFLLETRALSFCELIAKEEFFVLDVIEQLVELAVLALSKVLEPRLLAQLWDHLLPVFFRHLLTLLGFLQLFLGESTANTTQRVVTTVAAAAAAVVVVVAAAVTEVAGLW